ncbi:MAG: protein translocase subunit SecD [Candidatus Saganbacteria bacterium]|nr:protein translocase subunit SecD [Candidatus Saganbacteria bacterium]
MGENLTKLKVLSLLVLVAAAAFIAYKFPLILGLDIQGGTRLVLEAQSTKDYKAGDEAVSGVMAVIRNRIDALGVTEPMIQKKGSNQIVLELPGIKDPEHAIKVLGETALLEFAEAEWAPGDESVLSPSKVEQVYGKGARIDKYIDRRDGRIISERPIILKGTVLTGADLKGSWPGVDEFGNPNVDIEFNAKGAGTFANVTERNVGKPIAILLDKKIISAPSVREPIPSGRAQISGSFTIEQVQDLVVQLRGGSLPVPIKILETKIVGPTLGRDSLDKSKFAGLVGIIAIIVFMIAYYRFPGLLADLSLVFYFFFTLAVLSVLRTTLTLPGIAGFLLSIGMAVDANVIIFERLKEELQSGKDLRMAIDTSFHRAFAAILDSNVTTVIAAGMLFFFGTGTIKGFAVTLCVGIIVSMFTAILLTRFLMDLMIDWKLVTDPKSGMLYRGFGKK